MTTNLSNTSRVAVVTGGAMGIGAGCVKRLAELGHHVFITDRDYPAAQDTAEKLCLLGLQVNAVAMDVSNPSQLLMRLNT